MRRWGVIGAGYVVLIGAAYLVSLTPIVPSYLDVTIWFGAISVLYLLGVIIFKVFNGRWGGRRKSS